MSVYFYYFFFFSSRRRHTRWPRDWSSDVCSSDLGLEVHVQLATDTKLFSGSSTAYGAEPNTQASANDLAMPGTLPVPNEAAFRYAVMFGLAVNAEIAKR